MCNFNAGSVIATQEVEPPAAAPEISESKPVLCFSCKEPLTTVNATTVKGVKKCENRSCPETIKQVRLGCGSEELRCGVCGGRVFFHLSGWLKQNFDCECGNPISYVIGFPLKPPIVNKTV